MTTTGAPAEAEKVTLLVGTSSTSCSKCGLNALPEDETHDRAPAWSDTGRRGCGARFTHIVATYTGISDERLQQMRPDLKLLVAASDSPPGAVGDCGRGVRLTKHGRLATHNTKRDGGSLCPGAGLNP